MEVRVVFFSRATDHGFHSSLLLPTGVVSWDSANLGELSKSLAEYARVSDLVAWPDGDGPQGVSSMQVLEVVGEFPRYRYSIDVAPEFRGQIPRVGTSWGWSRTAHSLGGALVGVICDLAREGVRQVDKVDGAIRKFEA